MTTEKCIHNLDDCIASGRFHEIRQHYKDYLQSHCHRPQKIWITDKFTGERRMIETDCGSCLHCLDKKECEWVTRLYSHLEDYKYCYFVTLTYRSFTPQEVEQEPYNLVIDYLKDALWLLDDSNYYHKYCYSPCVLVKKHYQNFLKRLRKYTGINDLTFYLSAEYGGTFARPHYHLLLFSNSPISHRDCIRAWSLAFVHDKNGWRQRTSNRKTDSNSLLRIPLGSVKYYNLVENGTITKEQIEIEGSFYSAARCFAYVCKYLGKNEYNSNRVISAFHHYHKYYDSILFYTEDEMINKQIKFHDITPLYVKNLQLYDEDDFGYLCPVFPKDQITFVRLFKPFKECSRSTAIGSLYLKRNIEQFSKGEIKKSSLQDSLFVPPAYFKRKIKEYLFGLTRAKKATPELANKDARFAGVTFSYGNLPLLLADMHEANLNSFLWRYGHSYSQDDEITSYLNSEYCFRDNFTGIRYLVDTDVFSPRVRKFSYSRKLRKYIEHESISLEDFISYYTERYKKAYMFHMYELKQAECSAQKKQELEAYLHDVYDCVDDFKLALLTKELFDEIESTIRHDKHMKNTKLNFKTKDL